MTQLHGVHLYTLGCKANQYEGNQVLEEFALHGYPAVSKPDTARIIVINSCCVTLSAEGKSRRTAHRFRRKNPDAYIVLAGCLASLGHDDSQSIDLIVPQAEKPQLVSRVVDQIGEGSGEITMNSGGRTRAMLKVQDGCERRCSYCIIPDIRGAETSRSVAELKKEVKTITSRGVQEIVLSGMVLGGWRSDDLNFVDLLEELLTIDGFRLRISSLDVRDTTPELIQYMVKNPRICNHFHLPLQSGSADILAAMNRLYPPEDFAARVRQVHQLDPTAAVTTDVICGFPGETPADFAATHALLDGLPLFDLHVFPFSARPGTPAATFSDQVPDGVKRNRVDSLLVLAPTLRDAHFRRNMNQVRDVLVERNREGTARGLTDNYIPVLVKCNAAEGEMIRVRLQGPEGDGMRGEIDEIAN